MAASDEQEISAQNGCDSGVDHSSSWFCRAPSNRHEKNCSAPRLPYRLGVNYGKRYQHWPVHGPSYAVALRTFSGERKR